MQPKKIKLIIFDAYGVILKGGYLETCKILARKFNREWKELYNIIYVKYFNLAAEKKITQKDAWKIAVKETNLPVQWQEVRKIHYSLMEVNKPVIKFSGALREKNFKTLLLSKNTRSQFHDAEKKLNFKKNFDYVINTWEIGFPKASEKTMRYIMKKFHVRADEIIYIDDQEENLIAAQEIGVYTIFYENFAKFSQKVDKLLII